MVDFSSFWQYNNGNKSNKKDGRLKYDFKKGRVQHDLWLRKNLNTKTEH